MKFLSIMSIISIFMLLGCMDESNVVNSNKTKNSTVNSSKDSTINSSEVNNKIENISYDDDDFNSQLELSLPFDNSFKSNNTLEFEDLKKEYLNREVNKLVAKYGYPYYMLSEKNVKVMRYVIGNCPVVFFVGDENKVIDINTVCNS